MILVNGVEIDFDIGRCEDYKKFINGFDSYGKVIKSKSGVDDIAIRKIIIGMVGEENANILLKDGRIDTLLIVLVDIIDAAYDQYEAIEGTIEEVNARMESVYEKIKKREAK